MNVHNYLTSNARMLPIGEGIGMQGICMNDEQLMEHIESQTGPVIFEYSDIYEKFGVEVKWTYVKNENRWAGHIADNANNRAALARLKVYLDSLDQRTRAEIRAGNRFVTPPYRT